MAGPKAEGVTITYQDRVCDHLFEYTRHVGSEPSFGFLYMLRSDTEAVKGQFSVTETLPDPAKPVDGQTQEKPQAAGRGLLSAGSLVFEQTIDGKTHTTKWDQVFVSERALEVPLASDDGENEFVKVEITDPRYLWRTRGAFSAWVNIPKLRDTNPDAAATGKTQSRPPDATTAAQNQATSAARLKRIADINAQILSEQKTLDGLIQQREAVDVSHPQMLTEAKDALRARIDLAIAGVQAQIQRLQSAQNAELLGVTGSVAQSAQLQLERLARIDSLAAELQGLKTSIRAAESKGDSRTQRDLQTRADRVSTDLRRLQDAVAIYNAGLEPAGATSIADRAVRLSSLAGELSDLEARRLALEQEIGFLEEKEQGQDLHPVDVLRNRAAVAAAQEAKDRRRQVISQRLGEIAAELPRAVLPSDAVKLEAERAALERELRAMTATLSPADEAKLASFANTLQLIERRISEAVAEQSMLSAAQQKDLEAAASANNAASTARASDLISGSTRNGQPWQLRQFIEEKILPELPFSPKLRRFPADKAGEVLAPHVWELVLPKAALDDLLDEFHLVIALNNDATVSIWKENEGDLQLDPIGNEKAGQRIDVTTPPATWDDRVASARQLLVYRHVPAVCVVVGSPIIVSERSGLEAVGVKGGRWVPLRDALQEIGLSRENAAKLALLPQEMRAALMGVSRDGFREFERWAFKAFRLPGGVTANSGKLPIMNARATADSSGKLLPVRVWSETHGVASTLQAALAAARATGAKSGASPTLVNEVLDRLQKADTSHLRAVFNLPFAEQASGWNVDHEHGVVTFEAVQGHVAREGAAIDEAALADADAHVELEFAFVRKPNEADPLSFAHRYRSSWIRGKNGAISQAVDPPPGSAPLLIRRPELQQVDGADGSTNKGQLDEIAKRLALQQLQVPLSSAGAIVEFCRPVPIMTTGAVLSAEWRCDNAGIVTATAHQSVFAAFAPPANRTRAFGQAFAFDRVLKDSLIVPQGLK